MQEMRKVDLVYRPEGPGWAASSPDAPEYVAYGESLAEVVKLAHQGIAFHFDLEDDSELSISDFVQTPPGIVLAESNSGVAGLAVTVSSAISVGVNTGETVVRSTAPQSVRTADVSVTAA